MNSIELFAAADDSIRVDSSNEIILEAPEIHVESKKFHHPLMLRGACRISDNSVGGQILSFTPDCPVPMKVSLGDLLFILNIPKDDRTVATAYCRLQDKNRFGGKDSENEVRKFRQLTAAGHLREKKDDKTGEIRRYIVSAPNTRAEVDLSQIVVIATIPSDGKSAAPVYFKRKQPPRFQNTED